MAIAFIHNKRPGVAINKHTHEYIAKVTPPTCTERGYTTHTCKCGEAHISDYVDALGHNFSEEWFSDATGHWHTCSRCGAKDEVIEHLAGAEATTETPQTCVVCGYIIVPALHTHAYGDWEIVVAATCTTAGQKRRSCPCGASETEEIPALGHYLNHTMLVAPTCIQTGKGYFWCERCNYSKYDYYHTTAHTAEAIKRIPASCTESGSEGGKKCSVCNTILEEPKTILPLGHKYNMLGDLYKEATCTEDAVYYGKCVLCHVMSPYESDMLTEANTATGHKWVSVGSSTVCEYCGITKP